MEINNIKPKVPYYNLVRRTKDVEIIKEQIVTYSIQGRKYSTEVYKTVKRWVLMENKKLLQMVNLQKLDIPVKK